MSVPADPARARLLAEGRAAFPAVAVDDRAILDALGPREADVRCTTDLFLAAAVHTGDPEALRALDALFADIGPALRGVVPDHEIADVIQELHVKLVLGRSGSPPALLAYRGKGPLRAWLRVALLRAGFDRRRVPAAAAADEAAWIAHATETPDPVLETLRRSAGPIVRAAFEQALARLASRDRLLLRQHLLDGLSAPELAAFHGVHRVTAFRWLATIRRQVLDDVREALSRELGLGQIALDSLMRLMRASAVPTVERMLLQTPEPG